MNKIKIGTNLLIGCLNPFVIANTPLFSYLTEPEGFKINFDIPSPPSKFPIHVKENKIIEGNVLIDINQLNGSILLNTPNRPTKIFEIRIDNDMAIVNLDLRPLALHIFTDTNTLHIGGAQLSGNIIRNCTNGIVIGD